MRDAFIRAGRRALGYADDEICAQCATRWTRPADQSRRTIVDAADRYAALLTRGDDRDQPRPPGVWSPTAYTVHVGDWLRIWSARLIAVAGAPATPLESVDQDALAAARAYEDIARPAALHMLRTGAREILDVFDEVGVVAFDHPDFGPADSEAVLSWLAHDVDHHAWDVACWLP